MQSFIQYRRFRAAAELQIERDKAKAEGLGIHDRTREEQSPNSSTTEDSIVDLEKGDAGSEEVVRTVRENNNASGIGTETDQEKHGDLPKDARSAEPAEPVETNDFAPHEEDDDDEDEDFELRQNATMRSTLSRTTTQQSAGTKLGQVLTGIDIRKRTTTEGGDGNVFVVGYEGDDDPNNPHNWSNFTRIRCTLTIAMIGVVVGFASAIDSAALPQAARDFHVSEIVESLATGLFLVGFGVGALVAGPFSETFGRNPVYIATLALYMIFVMASGLAPNIGAQLAFRFIAGVFASTPLTCAGGSISDLWDPLERVYMFPVFANAAFCGPLLGPVMGGFIAESSAVSWRWVEWTTLIFSAVVLTIVVLTQPETFPPILLKWKAQHLRSLTGDQRYRGAIEIRQESLFRRIKRSMYRPFVLTFREPIIMLVALYLSVVYIVLFGFLDGFTFIFSDTYGLSQGLTGLCFLAIIVGLCTASLLVPLVYKWAKQELAEIKERGGTKLAPEFRLWFSMLGGSIAIPVSLFWMGWTARADISIWSPLASCVLFGYGILCVFITCYQYIIDSYETYAASALASITLIRYLASGGMVIVALPFFGNLGVAYTLTILACVSALLAPLPYLFYTYGPWVRSKSKYAVR